jgi:nucleoid DNA-binding protein
MSESTSTSELVDRLAKETGITKKLATEILRAIPEVVEEGLMSDGDVRIRGLGTFRMKWTEGRIGRNPKTGQIVGIPPHDRLVFLPEQSLKDFINRDYRLLSYKVIPGSGDEEEEDREIPEYQIIEEPDIDIPFLPERDDEDDGLLPEPEPREEIDYSYEPEPEPPVRKRRSRWVVAAIVAVIAILSVVFYFRNFYEGSRQSAVSSQQSSVDSSQSSVVSRQSSVDSLRSSVSAQQSAISNPQSEDTSIVKPVPVKKPDTIANRQSPIDNRKSIKVTGDNHLFQLARETYGNPIFWVLIYKANQDKISNPDQNLAGMELIIPALEGTPKKLSHNDSLEVAEGFRLVYEYYTAKGNPKAKEFELAYRKYKPD